jgi:hypothetical protein
MDVTPTKGMLETMEAFTDAVCGEQPDKKDAGPGAMKRRANRRMVMDFLHNLVRLSMREGVGRHYVEMGWPVRQDEVRPNPLKRAVDGALDPEKIILPH